MDMIDKNYAGFWRRYAAYIIDCLVLIILYEILSVSLKNILTIIQPSEYYRYYDRPFMPPAYYIRQYIILLPFLNTIYWCYFAGMECSPLQATIGKLAVGLYVTDLKGERLSFGRATARHFSKILSGLSIVGYWLAGWTQKKQSLHDMISGCLVRRR